MNAVESYRKIRGLRWSQRTNEQWAVLADKADAAIAELENHRVGEAEAISMLEDAEGRVLRLEGELRKWKADFRAMETVALDHEAELAALKGRRCETCNHWRFWVNDGPEHSCCDNEVLDAISDADGHNPSAEFACNRWAAREETP